jgi:hypothetical protein
MMNVNEIGIVDLGSRSVRRARALVLAPVAILGLFFGAPLCQAQTDLARLLPPDAPVIAGMRRVPEHHAKDALWLATRNNADDLNRLVELTNLDPGRRVDQVMVADWPSDGNRLGNHLLIAQGQFNLAHVFPSRDSKPLARLNYHGISICAIETSGSSKPPVRWLAVPRRDVALFGTPSAVQYALDRFLNSAPPDPALVQRLKQAQAHDAAWSSLLLDAPPVQARATLYTSDAFSACVARLRQVGLAIHLGSTVTIDLDMQGRNDANETASGGTASGGTASGGTASGGTMQCVSEALFGTTTPEMRVSFSGDQRPHVRVSMRRSDYDRWLDSFRASHTHQLLEAMISGSEPASESTADPSQTFR